MDLPSPAALADALQFAAAAPHFLARARWPPDVLSFPLLLVFSHMALFSGPQAAFWDSVTLPQVVEAKCASLPPRCSQQHCRTSGALQRLLSPGQAIMPPSVPFFDVTLIPGSASLTSRCPNPRRHGFGWKHLFCDVGALPCIL